MRVRLGVGTAAAATPLVALVAACGAEAPPEVIARFDIDIVVSYSTVTLRLRDVSQPICEPDQYFPRPGECAAYTDTDSCGTGDRDVCLTRVAVERDGFELASGELRSWFHSIQIVDPEESLFTRGEVELVIEGCGGDLRVPLGAPTTAPPRLTDLTIDGSYVRGWVAPTGATGTWASLANGGGGEACQEPSDRTWRVRPLVTFDSRADLYLGAIVGTPSITTPWGDGFIWRETLAPDAPTIALPTRNGDGWDVSERQNIDAILSLDGGTPTFAGSSQSTWGMHQTGADVLVHANLGSISYVAGETMDTLSLSRIDGRFVGTFPHVTPTNDLDLALAGDDRVVIAIGPVTLTHESNPALTHQVSVELSWEHPLVPRPVP